DRRHTRRFHPGRHPGELAGRATHGRPPHPTAQVRQPRGGLAHPGVDAGVLDADRIQHPLAGGSEPRRAPPRPGLLRHRLGGHGPVGRHVGDPGELPHRAHRPRGGDEGRGETLGSEVYGSGDRHGRPLAECHSWRLRGLEMATVPARRLRATARPPWIVVTQGTPTLRAAWRITRPSERARPPRGVLITSWTSPARMRSRVSRGPSPTLLTGSAG